MTDVNPFDAVVSQQPEASDNPFDSVVGNTPAPAAPAANPFDKVVVDGAKARERQQFLETLKNSKGIVPERQAQAIETAQLRGVPVGVAYKYLEDLQPKPQTADYESMTHQAPVTARLLADPVKGPVAFPDAQPLADIEQHLAAFTSARPGSGQMQGPPQPGTGGLLPNLTPEQSLVEQQKRVSDAAGAVKAANDKYAANLDANWQAQEQARLDLQTRNQLDPNGAYSGKFANPMADLTTYTAGGDQRAVDAANGDLAIAQQVAPTQSWTVDKINTFARELLSSASQVVAGLGANADAIAPLNPLAGVTNYLAGKLGIVPTDKNGRNPLTAYLATVPDAVAQLFPEDPAQAGDISHRLTGGVSGSLPMILAAIATKGESLSPEVMAGLVGALQQAGQAEQDAVAHGATPVVKGLTTLLGDVLGASEMVPFSVWANASGKGLTGFINSLIEGSLTEGAQNVVQQVPGDLWAQHFFDPKRDVVGNAVEAGKMGLAVGGLFSSFFHVVNSAAEASHQRLLAIGEAAKKTRLSDLSRTLHDEAIAAMPGLERVTAPIHAVETLFQEFGPEAAKQFPETAKSLEEAKAHQGNDPKAEAVEVTIPAPELVRLGKLKGYNDFTTDVRVGDDLTFNEKMDQTKQLLSELGTMDTAQAATPQEDSPVFQGIRAQLVKAGNSPDVATTQARLFDAMLTNMAERSSIPVADLARRYGVEISNTAIDGAAAGQTTLNQDTSSPAFKTWFGGSKVVDEKGAPIVVYHGTDKSFSSFKPGSFFSSSQDLASGYGEGKSGRIVPAYLSIKNPASGADVIRVAESLPGWHSDLVDEYPGIIFNQVPGVMEALKKEGFDGAAFDDGPGGMSDAPDAPTYVAFEPTQIKSVDNQGTFDPNNPNILFQTTGPADEFLSSLNDRERALVNPIYTGDVPAKKLKGNEEAARWLEKHFTGTAVSDFTKALNDAVLQEIGNVMAAEAIHALQKTGNAFDWYTTAMTRALKIAQIKWPALGDDAAAAEAGFGTAANTRFVFTYIMAVTSQNLDVAANATATNKAFDEMLARVKAGDFTMSKDWGTGDKQAAMGENFAKFGPLIEAMDGVDFPEKLALLDNLFRRKMSVADWVREMKADGVPYSKPGQTAMDAIVYGSSLLGPKIGNGFWQNLNGNFTPLTIDLWMRRTWGRLTGKSIGNEKSLPAQRKRLKASVLRSINSPELDMDPLLSVITERRANLAKIRTLEARTDLTKKEQTAAIKKLNARNVELEDMAADYRGIPAPEGWKPEYDTDNAALAAYAKRLLGAWNKEYKKLREKYGKKVPAKMQPTWARGAKRLKADLTTPLDQVGNGTQRKQIEKAVAHAQAKLASLGYNVTTADLQAILWYPEKELWGALTTALAVDEDGDPVIPPSPLNESYDTVFARILNAEGYDTGAQQGAAGNAAGGGDVSAVAGQPDAAARPGGPQDQVVPGSDGQGAGGTPQAVNGGPQAGPSSSQGTTLNQGGKDVRGSISFGPLRDKFLITLTEKANLSTFLHEGGHFFLEVLQDLVQRGEASAQQVADLKTLKRWMGIDDAAQVDRNGHEKFARTFEAFLMEGKAPSLALHGIFQKFKAWMIFVYKRMANVRGELNDEVRSVMDRLVASDAAIAEARTMVGWRGEAMSQEETGLTDAEYKAYVGQWMKANDAQSADADARIMLEAARELKKTWTDEKTKVTKEAEAALAETRGYKAWKLLQNGEGLDEIGRTTLKIDPASIPKEWRAGTAGMTASPDQGGVDLDMAAELLGFDTGEQMLQSIGGAKLSQKAIPAKVRQIMVERHGEMDAATLSQEAMKAVHNTPTMDVLLTEFRALAAKANLKIGKDTRRLVTAAAEERVAQTQVRKLEPSKWRRAEVKAAEEAGKLAAKGKDMEAALAKRRQLMAAAMAKASLEAQDRASSIKDYLDTFTTNRRRAALGKAGDSYLDQVDQILEAVQLKEVSLKAIKARQGLDEFVKEQEAAGEPVFISSETRDLLGRKNYTEMSLQELEGVHDAVKNLWTVAKEINVVRRGAEKIALENALSAIEKETEELLPVKKQRDHLNPSKIDKMMGGLGRYHAGNLKMEFVLDWLGKTAHSLIYQPITDASHASWKLHRDLTAPFMDKLRKLPKEQKQRWNTKRQFLNYPMPLKGANIWTIALNMGNEGNKAKMLAGYGWTESQVMAELSTFMTKEDWDLAQETWDTIDKMWPKMAEVVKRATGLTPPKVEAVPIDTPHGTYRGGYFPVVYDTAIDSRMDDKLDSSISPEEMFSKRFTAFVINNGFTKGRTANVGKLLFSPDIIAQHLGEVIHYATHYDAVKQADKIIRSPVFKSLVKTHLGDAVYRELKQWLKDVATNTTRSDRTQQAGDKAMRYARNSAQLTSLGINIKSALKQPLGIITTLDALKAKHWAIGIQEAWLSPNAVTYWKEAFAKSKELGPLIKNYDRDAATAAKAYADSLGDRAKVRVYEIAFAPISVMQSVANVAAWRGAYSQANEQGMSEEDAINFADKVVRTTQGSGALKDLSGMQRGGEVNKFFTMFYSYFGVLYNRLADVQAREAGLKNLHRKVGRLTVLLLMGELLNTLGDDAWDAMFPPDKKKPDDTPFLVRLALNTVDSTLNTLPIARDVYSAATAIVGGGQVRTPPALAGVGKAIAGGKAISDLLQGKDMTRGKGRNIAALVGLLTNQPVYGVYKMLDDILARSGNPIFEK
ncbi:hypothetical protein UFOVP143_4 [uncultured Caudovirales phage]|uniref:Uncharacterized protein n=1 Tax=uncultured Caudovirales phage TaxID=2100421 RepID=A0A6J7VNN8_9CAUD|nr:hypothetical protein UFOVP143_4 [uncultured Caudovirales phage]